MDNMISGLLGVGVFAAFTLGLAESINTWPFYVIVIAVVVMVGIDLKASIKEGFEEERAAKEENS